MRFVRWLRRLVSLPLVWAGRLLVMFRVPLGVPVLKAAWHVSGRGEIGRLALAAVEQHHGAAAARALAEAWLAARPRPELAALAGLHAVRDGDRERAATLLALGRQLGDDPEGMLDLLEFILALGGDDRETIECARRFEARRDAPMLLSRLVRIELLWDALLGGRFDEAADRAGRLLAIEAVPEAEMALWALANRRGDGAAAGRHLRRAALPPARQTYFQVLGHLAVGAVDEARDLLPLLAEADPALAQNAETRLRRREAPA